MTITTTTTVDHTPPTLHARQRARIKELEAERDTLRVHDRHQAAALLDAVSRITELEARVAELATINRIQATTVTGMEAQLAELLPHAYAWTLDPPDGFCAGTPLRERIKGGEFGPWPQEPVVEDAEAPEA